MSTRVANLWPGHNSEALGKRGVVVSNLVGFQYNALDLDGFMRACLLEKSEQRGMSGGRGKYLRKKIKRKET